MRIPLRTRALLYCVPVGDSRGKENGEEIMSIFEMPCLRIGMYYIGLMGRAGPLLLRVAPIVSSHYLVFGFATCTIEVDVKSRGVS